MSAPVDVLAVMDADIAARDKESHTGPSAYTAYHQAVAARAAVSALIGVAQCGKREGDAQERRQWLAELDAALARVQGGAA